MSFYRPMPAVPCGTGRWRPTSTATVAPRSWFPTTARFAWLALYGGVRMLDGATGETRWDCPLWPGMKYAYDSLVHLLAAPDLDADGTRDLVVVSRFMGRQSSSICRADAGADQIYVDAVSGKNGRRLWHWRTEINHWDTTPVGPLFWWGRGSDGWPMLALPDRRRPGPRSRPPGLSVFSPDPPVVHLARRGDRPEAHRSPAFRWPKTADLDGDGLADLWGAVDGKLRALSRRAARGVACPRSVARRPVTSTATASATWSVTTSRRPDGLAETKESGRPSPGRAATAGSCGRRCSIPGTTGFSVGNGKDPMVSNPLTLPGGDLDGDGAPDVLVHRSTYGPALEINGGPMIRLQALSGRTGRRSGRRDRCRRWGLEPPGIPAFEESMSVACEGRGLADVFVLHDITSSGEARCRQAHTTSRSRIGAALGSRRPRHLGRPPGRAQGGIRQAQGFVHEFADLDGDGSLEMVLLLNGMATPGHRRPFELRVLSLRDGETRWTSSAHHANRAPARVRGRRPRWRRTPRGRRARTTARQARRPPSR